jgi:hypothetical protein
MAKLVKALTEALGIAERDGMFLRLSVRIYGHHQAFVAA